MVRSLDGGQTWEDRKPGGPFDTHTLVMHRLAPNHLFAAAGDGCFASQRDLLRDISHELRSPLTRLNLALELARSGPGRFQALDRIEREASRLNTLVGELLSLARMGSGQPGLRLAAVRVDQLVGDLV